jgi:hypothetical protein
VDTIADFVENINKQERPQDFFKNNVSGALYVCTLMIR